MYDPQSPHGFFFIDGNVEDQSLTDQQIKDVFMKLSLIIKSLVYNNKLVGNDFDVVSYPY
jgi:hypothetical protein